MNFFTYRGFTNLGCLVLLCVGLLALLYVDPLNGLFLSLTDLSVVLGILSFLTSRPRHNLR